MDMLKTLDIILGLVFVYLVFSLCVTALNEFVAAALSSRARWLRKGVTALLTPLAGSFPEETELLSVDKVYQSPFISALGQASWMTLHPRFAPSYVPAWTLVQGVLDAAAGTAGTALGTFEEVKAAVAKLPNRSPIKVGLQTLISRADQDLEALKVLVETWFSTIENQISAWYRQKTQYMLVGLSLFIAVAMNLDTLAMVQVLSNESKTRSELAERGLDAARAESGPTLLGFAPLRKAQEEFASAKIKGATADDLAKLQSKVEAELVALDSVAKQLVESLASTGLPMGWKGLDFWGLPLMAQLYKVLGWLLTAFALSLGAPFWFDLLQKLTLVRSVGKSLLERKQAEDKPAGA